MIKVAAAAVESVDCITRWYEPGPLLPVTITVDQCRKTGAEEEKSLQGPGFSYILAMAPPNWADLPRAALEQR